MNKLHPSEKIAVLLLAFGGPDSPSAIEPFLNNVLGARNISPEKILQIKERYLKIGGKSPLFEITARQADLLEKKLGDNFNVFVGMRYWHPFISDTIAQIKEKGFKKIIAIPMTPYFCSISTGAYQKEFDKALNVYREDFFKTRFILNWHTSQLFVEAILDIIKKSCGEKKLSEFQIIFSFHSVPQAIIDKGDPYLNQINETIKKILEITGDLSWYLGFQSKGGGQFKWLEPEVIEIIDKISLSPDNNKDVLLVPLGFISDHVETLYDIDIQIKNKAIDKGLIFHRAQALNDHPKLISALAEIVKTEVHQFVR